MSVVWTLSEASGHCQVSKRTLMRRIGQLEEGGAYRDRAGVWHVTPEALRAAGFAPGRPSSPDAPSASASVSSDSALGAAELSQLRAELAEWKARAQVAEAVAAERLRLAETLTASLRALEAARPQPAAPAPTPTPQGGAVGRTLRWLLGAS